MNNTSLQVNSGSQETEFLSMAEAAKLMLVTADTMRALILRHEQYLTLYIRKQVHSCKESGLTRRMKVITKQGLVILANLRNEKDKTINDRRFLESKKVLAEKAIENKSSLKNGIIPKELQNKIDLLVNYVNEQKLLDPPESLTNGQRDFLNERVRYYAASTLVSHGWIWRKLHNFVQRDSIDHYKFEDYRLATKYLKDMYKASHLNWN